MQTIKCFSISSNDQLDLVYIMLNSLKTTKHSQTNIKYYLLLDLNQQKDMEYCINYFLPLASKDFDIVIYKINNFLSYIDRRLESPYTNVKCFAPKIFKDEDKILVIDTDMVFARQGIEQLWNTNITNKYCAAVQEPLVTYYAVTELKNTKTKRYFNAGLILFNLKKIREDKLDDDMMLMINNWDYNRLRPLAFEQSLLNYLFKENVVFLNFKFNNPLLVITPKVVDAYSQFLWDRYREKDWQKVIREAVILHFLGQNKPWKQEVKEKYSAVKDFPYKDVCLRLWDQIEQKYKRKEEN